MIKHFPLVVATLVPGAVVALPYADGILSVGDREFFVGERSWALKETSRVFRFKQSPWLLALVADDPILEDQLVRFLETGVPAAEIVGSRSDISSDLLDVEPDSVFFAEGHKVVFDGSVRMEVFPEEANQNYSVSCTRSIEEEPLNFCRIRVEYPYDSHVVISADEFFPGTLPEISAEFGPIADRLIEIAICLDVTNSPSDDLDEAFLNGQVELLECEIDLVS